MMKSHVYSFSRSELLGLVGPVLMPLALFVLFVRGGVALELLPKPMAALDTDRTILFHQAQATLERHEASQLVIGDSSCLMDVDVMQLDRLLPEAAPTLNLGTLSYLDLPSFGSLLEHYVSTNPNRLRRVILLLNPEALRRASATDYHVEALNRFYQGTDFCSGNLPPLLCGLGVEIFRGRLLSRAMPQPLAGAYGRFYGFTHDLWNYLSEHHGSAIDPGQFDPASSASNGEYRLAKSVEKASQAFRAALPPGLKLYVGITPLPQSAVAPGYPQRYREMLAIWSQWLKADAALTELPKTLPDDLFASATHLNERGVRLYTEQIAVAVSRHGRDPR